MEKRVEILKLLNNLIMDIGDEDVFEGWFAYGIPDGATEEDYKEIAEDTGEFKRIVKVFSKIYED